ncbi:MAG: tRNA (adenosine(37)-N6)-dimethylallyltransferase MiaA [Firmicutes bacterium]|nr:tRNA (adenosine(37)-N6)-dimethylallyltransferase MiaA [Bacillota bacterium]
MAATRLIVIAGPTATGKSAAAVALARRIGGEVVSADSMQVYCGLEIATAQVPPAERQGIPHHLMGILPPETEFTVAAYQEMADAVIAGIRGRGRWPILVGGTGLYIKAVVDGFLFPGPGRDPALRARLEEEAETQGDQALYARLQKVDPAAAARIHPGDRRRVVRALEVYLLTGIPISVHQERQKSRPPRYDAAMFALTCPREELYDRINRRVEVQLTQGLVEEARRLQSRGVGPHLTAWQALGLKEIRPYLDGQVPLAEAVELLKRNTRRYAKRQLTWFRQDPRYIWLDSCHLGVEGVVREILRCIKGRWPDLPNYF